MAVLLVCPVVNGLLPANARLFPAWQKQKSRPFRRQRHYYHLIFRRQQKPAFPPQLAYSPGPNPFRDMRLALR
jgi:hypothetical protein